MSRGPAAAGDGERLPWRRELLHRVESLLFTGLIRAICGTCRVRVVAGGEHLARLREAGGVAVIAYWHDRLFLGSWLVSKRLIRRGYPVTALVSPSRDGELAARTAMRLGARVVRGSSSRGGSSGVRALLREAAAGRGLVVI
ncbi:MAG TPA: DUF374 domain-containing protein, partial [Thermoanaerobaculia bacterium]|nr:DUF374 domain-containing protein [Thermoanaerobaculia bacterium]